MKETSLSQHNKFTFEFLLRGIYSYLVSINVSNRITFNKKYLWEKK